MLSAPGRFKVKNQSIFSNARGIIRWRLPQSGPLEILGTMRILGSLIVLGLPIGGRIFYFIVDQALLIGDGEHEQGENAADISDYAGETQ